VKEVVAMSEDPGAERLERLIDELNELPPEEREAAIESLSIEDRAAVWEAELEANEAASLDDDELGGEA
jgi:ATP-dependent exoDNAse (exonuclease V) alpha subunit